MYAACACLLALAATAAPVDFAREVRPILQRHCYDCHGEKKQKSGLRLDVKAAAFKGGEQHGPTIIPGRAKESPLARFVTTSEEDERMPPKGERLSAVEIATLTSWIDEGALWPDGVDTAKLADLRDHWSFKPVVRPAPPGVSSGGWARNDIDRFILARLEKERLKPSSEADRVSWLRRVYFDLIGLPPSPGQVDAFVKDRRRDACERVVEELLASPRYGERWAQHWLDVVRYADTHGFEVNTERPHAWPYRDYVIRSFNNDTPYDRFIKEQVVGDALGEDAATGFLITASVLLPGQIGKDAPSIRLARQDSLDEMVNNIGQTFLGLSVGCARCHDHKFDPITAKDYYAMQAFVAGVEYEDRPLRTSEADARKREAEPLRRRVADIGRQLAQFVPLARPFTQRRTTSAKENTETFAPIDAKFVRFTMHDAKLHPTLGLIEPCVDEFEIFTDEAPPRNLAPTAKVTASGSRTSEIHKLDHISDGKYGNSRSWMADTAGRGWVMFELPQPARLAKVVWSRDREGKFTDRLATAFTLEAGPAADSLTTLVNVPPLRPTVNPRGNTDRFTPVKAKRVRFTVKATNSLEPCLDELEVFNSAGENVALASRGTTVTTSGDTTVADRHEQRFINDGRYGNSRSWMSNEPGGGWAVLEFLNEEEISRVVWSRDRESHFEDRLPTEYRIEVAGAADDWRVVADSTDRRPFVAGMDAGPAFTLAGLAPAEAAEAKRLLDEKRALEAKIKAAEAGQLVFAGKFRAPDKIHLLNRGDPEQPKEEVAPAMLSVLGTKKLARDAAEQERRRALADWIASPENPLTARVMVNRIWQGHFGTGLVDTSSDFGRNGAKPSHPELLDWLASEFVRGGWSVKQMHRLIVLSATYRQSSSNYELRTTKDEVGGRSVGSAQLVNRKSEIANEAQQRDSDVRLLWRFPSRRLESEPIRDAMLAVSGQLNLKMYGRGFDLFNQRGGLTGFKPVEAFSGDGLRRMIYAHKVRRETEAVFGAFDCPDAGQSTARRRESTTPIQALNLFNSRFTIDQAEAFSARVKKEAGDDVTRQIHRAYQLALSRQATASELAEARPFVVEHGLVVLCRALFNSNEFLFVP
jgi:mono/diheme cytochrome c family protein